MAIPPNPAPGRRLAAREYDAHSGIRFATASVVLGLDDLAPPTPRLPHRRFGLLTQLAASAGLHICVLTAVVMSALSAPDVGVPRPEPGTNRERFVLPHVVFLAPEASRPGRGGGGGGNRQPGQVRAAQAAGSDAITGRRRTPPPAPSTEAALPDIDEAPPPSSVLDVKPMAAGLFEQIGLPGVPPSSDSSLGPGTGGGVGSGSGTGVGPGRGSGFGDGTGGGTGGGIYRPGGAVTAPRLVEQVNPRYTPEALARSIQGTVLLEAVVTPRGTAAQLRVVRSLDPGLDMEAIAAVEKWRFEPGRLAGQPVSVLVTIMVDFWIR